MRRRSVPLPVLPVAAVVALKTALGAAVLGRYGWQRDELYYAVAARHLSFGYVDFPPVTALLAAGSRVAFGESLVALRALALAAGAVTIVVCSMIGRELGGGRRAQVLAAAVAALTPFVLAENTLFQPVSFDLLVSAVVLWLGVRLSFAPSRRLWIAIGIAVGIGLETKYTIAVLALGLLVAALVLRRDVLRVDDVVLAAAIALVLVAPNLLWQVGHRWASVRFFVHPGPSATSESRPQYVADLVLLAGIGTAPVWIAGFRLLHRDERTRWLAWGVALVAAAYLVLGGKSYYALPVFVLPIAAGSIWLDRWLSSGRRLAIAVAVVALVTVPLLPIGVPVLPTRTMADWKIWKARADYKDEIGWQAVVDDVARAARMRPAAAVIASNYGEAGALDVLGKRRALPPTVSGHMSYRYWRPKRLASRSVVVVGYDESFLRSLCASERVVVRIAIPYGIDNEEKGEPVATCTLRAGLDALWPALLSPRL
jgi:4-amino-4-deoxy-L-arabinose transferase-like glycosyltransferase